MESATLRRLPALPEVLRLGLLGLLLLLALVAWVAVDERMQGMDAGPGTDLGALGFYVTTWVVMMSAMMFPSIAPMVLMYARMEAGRRERGRSAPFGATALFVGGYLVAWTVAGLAGYAIFGWAASLSIDAFSWDRGGPLSRRRSAGRGGGLPVHSSQGCLPEAVPEPAGVPVDRLAPGRLGAMRMGIEHGAWCVGCCWALMAALFALGVMSIGWMAFIAALIALEKLLPWKAYANRGIALLLVALGIAVAFAPGRVPGLTLPSSPQATEAMRAMGMDEDSRAPGGQMAPRWTAARCP